MNNINNYRFKCDECPNKSCIFRVINEKHRYFCSICYKKYILNYFEYNREKSFLTFDNLRFHNDYNLITKKCKD
jgi:hypothetical protein